ncbi:hypothetical protein KQH90_03675 [Anaerosalibacter bizertensis]|uniref:hypothetical protein n=1 Tax=Anaerosalibacter bizertensis TaxID=932217 RepID=UPI001C0EADE1|nr:hypothetical protein [Anaerosalibacter bizertensis]MBU5293136.1 hypothetical protein [Anaerosalibacter bizertensis]
MLPEPLWEYVMDDFDKGLDFKCCKCGQNNHVNIDENDLDFEYSKNAEREMGTEYVYSSYNYLICDNCKKENELEVMIYEYSVGAYNMHTIKVNGKEVK